MLIFLENPGAATPGFSFVIDLSSFVKAAVYQSANNVRIHIRKHGNDQCENVADSSHLLSRERLEAR